MSSIYDFPEIFDQVLCHSPEEVQKEVDAIISLLKQRGMTSGQILELACGTCAHSLQLAKMGFEVEGIDQATTMLEGARKKAIKNGVQLELHEGDIIDFDIGKQFDSVIFMSETFPFITDFEDIKSHFRAVRRHLREGGIYIIDIDCHKYGVETEYQIWDQRTVQIDGGSVDIWHEIFPGDWVKGTSRMIMHCRIYFDGRTFETSDEWIMRVDTPWNLSVMVEALEDWSLQGFYSWKDLSSDISKEEHYFMVVE